MADTNKGLGRLAIIGGGISGVTLALALIKRGIHVQIYEQARHFGEIGAGVAFNEAAVRAMEICSPAVVEAFEATRTLNQWPSKRNVYFDILDGQHDTEAGKEKNLFHLDSHVGTNAVHRAHFLDAISKHLPDGITHFRKHLDTIVEQPDGTLQVKFHDGTTEEADAVIGCDGIKSSVRVWMFGDDHPASHPQYTHCYAYRGLIPVDRFRQELGDDLASNSYFHLGKDGHFLTFPVSHGGVVNVVAFKPVPVGSTWPSTTKLTLPSEKSHVERDFKDHGPTIQKIISLLEPDLDCWAIFDTGDHPVPHYNKGRVCLLGDAGHATSPHQGSGAGMCIEDCAIMAELLTSPLVEKNGPKGVEAAFKAYNDQRLERTQDLVQSSRRAGELWDLRAEGVGDDYKKLEAEITARFRKVWDGQVKDYIKEAEGLLEKQLKA
ncbi:putative salicylate hydroxylase [Myriangium duriaei CBS 260.36]|uniref:Salicylate hydroxylase n=1 Tax=Myriangium duriaei CBS 260.36 TaxID=1168546 RepID=A0A9P4J148_9PEZI|nr:putative salicylate hydroxylase [Myriangium duriaei CBS 260.36]